MCLSYIWYCRFGYCVLCGNWALDGCVDCIICTTNWFIQFSLEFWKGIFYNDFIIKDTNLIVYLPWLSGKQSTFIISCISIIVFLTWSVLSTATDPLVCVNLVFWKERNKCSSTFSSRVSFSRCWAFCPLFCFGGWKELHSARYQRIVYSWRQFRPWIGNSKSVYRQSTCWWWNQNASHVSSQIFNVVCYVNMISATGLEALLVIVACNTVFFTHNVLFICVCRNKKTVSRKVFLKGGIKL